MALFQILVALSKILDAIAWPVLVGTLVYFFRQPVQLILLTLPNFVNRVEKLTIAGIVAEMAKLGDAAAASAEAAPLVPSQREAAERVQSEARSIPLIEIEKIVDELVEQYERTRQELLPSQKRTNQMGQVVAKMRAVSLAAAPLFPYLKQSDRPGRRLMAVVILQLQPQLDELGWLAERFHVEVPFIFYHAAIALLQAAKIYGAKYPDLLEPVIRSGTDTVESFDGTPDANTLIILGEAARTLVIPR